MTSKKRPSHYKKLLFRSFLTLIGIGIIFLGFTFTQSKINNKTFLGQGADNLRAVAGSRFVEFLEKSYLIIVDQWLSIGKQKTKNVDSEQLAKLSSGKNSVRKDSTPDHIKPLIIDPPMDSKLGVEGSWKKLDDSQTTLYHTIIRPDVERHWAIVDLIWIDLSEIDLHFVVGNEYKDASGNASKGVIPEHHRDDLVLAFNGGFKPIHDNGGMAEKGITRFPFRYDKGTLIIYENGDIDIVNYTKTFEAFLKESDIKIAYARQNQPYLMTDGLINQTVKKWGYVVRERKLVDVNAYLGSLSPEEQLAFLESGRDIDDGLVYIYGDADPIYAWRSAIGLSEDKKSLIYAAGSHVSAQTLAYALKLAECTDAIHADMNPVNITFNYFTASEKGIQEHLVTKRFGTDLSGKYLKGYSHDYFYGVKKNSSLKNGSEPLIEKISNPIKSQNQ